MSRTRLVLLVVYTLANAGGMVFAAMMGEVGHAALHAALLIPVGWYLLQRRSRETADWTPDISPDAALPGRLTNLERSIDAVAIEVERIVEGQRNLTNLLADDAVRRAPEQGAPNGVRRDPA